MEGWVAATSVPAEILKKDLENWGAPLQFLRVLNKWPVHYIYFSFY